MSNEEKFSFLLEAIYEVGNAIDAEADVLTVNLLKLSLRGRVNIAVKGTIAEGSEKMLQERFVPLNDQFTVVGATVLAAMIKENQWGGLEDHFLSRDLGL